MKDRTATPIHRHAAEQASALLRRMAFQASRTAKRADADAVHDLRVSIRRLTQCLAVFGQFFPRGNARKVCRKAGALMNLASAVRDRDIALMLLRRAAMAQDSALVCALSGEREDAARTLRTALKRWSRRDGHRRWRSRLGL